MREAIIVQRLGKRFNRFHAEKPVTIMEAALSGLRRMKPVEHFWALRDVTFTVSPGQMLGVLGHNGAGKSTLLQLIGGVGRPDEGRVKVNGRIGALLDLGAGFHGDLTGRENVFVTAVVAGLSRREMARRFDAIVEFAELEQFIDNPVRTYSTGMQMRLAFSVAVHTNPDVLLVDEFLSVGDLSFQAKCLQRIDQLKADGCAIVLISHSAEQIQQLCDQALWLRRGQVVAHGEPEVVVGQYVNEMRHNTYQQTPNFPPQITQSGIELRARENRFGSQEVEIINVELLPGKQINRGNKLCIAIQYKTSKHIKKPHFSVSIDRVDGQSCLNVNTEESGELIPEIVDMGEIRLDIERLDLNGGEYFVNVGVYNSDWSHAYDYHWHAYMFSVFSPSRNLFDSRGFYSPPIRWQFNMLSFQDKPTNK